MKLKKWLMAIWHFFYVKDIKKELINGMYAGAKTRDKIIRKGGKK